MTEQNRAELAVNPAAVAGKPTLVAHPRTLHPAARRDRLEIALRAARVAIPPSPTAR